MSRYRIIENKKGSEVWYTIQVKYWWWMCWSFLNTYPDGFEEVASWGTYDEARAIITDRMHSHHKAEKEVVYDSGR